MHWPPSLRVVFGSCASDCLDRRFSSRRDARRSSSRCLLSSVALDARGAGGLASGVFSAEGSAAALETADSTGVTVFERDLRGRDSAFGFVSSGVSFSAVISRTACDESSLLSGDEACLFSAAATLAVAPPPPPPSLRFIRYKHRIAITPAATASPIKKIVEKSNPSLWPPAWPA